jgi:hypothetical protein
VMMVMRNNMVNKMQGSQSVGNLVRKRKHNSSPAKAVSDGPHSVPQAIHQGGLPQPDGHRPIRKVLHLPSRAAQAGHGGSRLGRSYCAGAEVL